MLVVSSPSFSGHQPPLGHPERPERAEVMSRVAARWESLGGQVVEPTPADVHVLARIHDSSYIKDIASTSGRRVQLDSDTYTSPKSEMVARLAAGAAIEATEHALTHSTSALAFVRPPGHHAERARAMGFCLYNNAAIAAAHAIAKGVERVTVIDYDVHHGNGTQRIFYDEPRVLYISTHQYPFYPGTGAATDIGNGEGVGTTVNIPLEAGAKDADFDLVFRDVVVPVVTAFEPQLVVLSAGFDAHADDPLGGMHLSTEGYRTLTHHVRRLAIDHCDGRLAVVTEGGYDLSALEECLEATLEVAAEKSLAKVEMVDGSTEIARAALGSVKRTLAPYWPVFDGRQQ